MKKNASMRKISHTYINGKQKTIILKMVLCPKIFVLDKMRFQTFNNNTLKGGKTMRATPYNWVNILSNNTEAAEQEVEEVEQVEEPESPSEQIPSDNIAQIVQLIEKLIDLTVDDSNRANKVTQKLLRQVESI